ncbi:hypothetical protein Tco_0510142, partial [Tanacetum coccineum]
NASKRWAWSWSMLSWSSIYAPNSAKKPSFPAVAGEAIGIGTARDAGDSNEGVGDHPGDDGM